MCVQMILFIVLNVSCCLLAWLEWLLVACLLLHTASIVAVVVRNSSISSLATKSCYCDRLTIQIIQICIFQGLLNFSIWKLSLVDFHTIVATSHRYLAIVYHVIFYLICTLLYSVTQPAIAMSFNDRLTKLPPPPPSPASFTSIQRKSFMKVCYEV